MLPSAPCLNLYSRIFAARLPQDRDDVKAGLIAYKIAAHAADLSKVGGPWVEEQGVLGVLTAKPGALPAGP